jgi:hypothetical protein
MSENESDIREQRKAWANRNSDQLYTFGDEEGAIERLYSPPAFDLVEDTTSSASPHVITDPSDSGFERHAVRHEHVWDPALEDPDA